MKDKKKLQISFELLGNSNAFTIDFPLKDQTTDEIDSFAYLTDGWDFGRGYHIKKELITAAKNIYLIANAYDYYTEPYPNPDGTITLVLSIEDHFIDIDIQSPDLFVLRYEVGKGEKYKTVWRNKVVKFEELEPVLITIKTECQQTPLSESSTSGTIIELQNIDSIIEEFSNKSEGEFQFFVKTVQSSSLPMEYAII